MFPVLVTVIIIVTACHPEDFSYDIPTLSESLSERKEITTEFKSWLNIIKELWKFSVFFSLIVAIWIVFSKLVFLLK